MGDFKTKCECGGDLRVVQLTVIGCIPLTEDGFSFDDPDTFDTTDEVVECAKCGKKGRLEYEF